MASLFQMHPTRVGARKTDINASQVACGGVGKTTQTKKQESL
jgi:hypothetical protein